MGFVYMRMIWLSPFIISFCQIVNGNPCAICLEEIGATNDILKLCCNHHYHGSCLYRWAKVKSKCPICKQRIVVHRDIHLFTEHDFCSTLMVEGLNLRNIRITPESTIMKLRSALKDLATVGYQQFLFAEELKKQEQARIKAQEEREARLREEAKRQEELEQAIINYLCIKLEQLSIEDDEYDNPPSIEY